MGGKVYTLGDAALVSARGLRQDIALAPVDTRPKAVEKRYAGGDKPFGLQVHSRGVHCDDSPQTPTLNAGFAQSPDHGSPPGVSPTASRHAETQRSTRVEMRPKE